MKARGDFHILVVEDHEEIRNSVCDVLENEGYRVSHAKDGLEALATVINGAKAPDLCVLDLMMPVMSGQKLLEALEEDKQLRKIPVIVMTASGMKPESPVVVATIAKPFAIQDLLDLVTFQLNRLSTAKA
jgi:CheY-like chemotaxis protein